MDVDLLDPHGDTAVVPGASEAPGGAAAPRPGARWWWAITAAAAVALLVRLWAVRDRIEYSLWPDEPAQLAIARLVGDGAHWTMRNHSIWRPGYGTLLGPVYAVTDDPQAVYRTAMVLNAVLGAVAAALLVVLARRLTGFGPRRAAAAAIAVSATPAVVFPAGFVWAESLIAPLYLGSLVALLRFVERPGVRPGLVVAVLCGAGFATHGRLLPLALVALVVVASVTARRRLGVAAAVVVAGAVVAAVLAAQAYTRWVTAELWEHPAETNSWDGVLAQLTHPWDVVVSALGQGWYLAAGSLGLLAIAAVHAGRRARTDPAYRVLAMVVVAQVTLSVVFMADRWRPDQVVYGRYNDIVVAPLLLVGLAAVVGPLGERWPLRRLLAGFAGSAVFVLAAGAVLAVTRSGQLGTSNGLEPMILAIQPFVDARPSLALVRISVVAVAAAAVLVAGVLTGRALGWVWPLGLVVAGLLVVGLVRTDGVMARGWGGSGDLRTVSHLGDAGDPLADGGPVDYYLPVDSDSTGRLMLYRWYLPASTFTVVDSPLDEATSRYVFAESNNAELLHSGAIRVWNDPYARVSLWDRDPEPGAIGLWPRA